MDPLHVFWTAVWFLTISPAVPVATPPYTPHVLHLVSTGIGCRSSLPGILIGVRNFWCFAQPMHDSFIHVLRQYAGVRTVRHLRRHFGPRGWLSRLVQRWRPASGYPEVMSIIGPRETHDYRELNL